MKEEYRRIRNALRSLPTQDAIRTVAAFHLLPEEEACVIACDIWRMSHIAASDKYGMSPETVKRRRSAAYSSMAQQMANMTK